MLEVIEFSHKVGRKSYWKCKCECGNYTTVRSDCLKDGNTKSCGCLNYKPTRVKHNETKTKLYGVWSGMKTRCAKSYHYHYHLYGGRGIKVCDEWLDYETFRDWALLNGYKEGLSIDRIDVNGDYCPDNCRWVTMQEQQHNKRTNIELTYNGETMNIRKWADKLGVTYNLLYGRLRKYNYDIEKAIESLN